MKIRKKYIFILIILIIASWCLNLTLFYAVKAEGPIFTYIYSNSTNFTLSYYLHRDDNDKVASISFPEINNNEYYINTTDYFFKENNNLNNIYPAYNYYFIESLIDYNSDNKIIYLGQEDIFNKPITKIKYKTESGKSKECNIGYYFSSNITNKEDNINPTHNLYRDEGYQVVNNIGEYFFRAKEDISIKAIEGNFKEYFSKYHQLYFNKELLTEFPIKINAGEQFNISCKIEEKIPSYEYYYGKIYLIVENSRGEEEKIVINSINTSYLIPSNDFISKDFFTLLKLREDENE